MPRNGPRRRRSSLPARAPRVGQHTSELLRAAGYGDAEIEATVAASKLGITCLYLNTQFGGPQRFDLLGPLAAPVVVQRHAGALEQRLGLAEIQLGRRAGSLA